MSRPRVLVTGAAGALGRRVSRHLADRCELVLLDREPRGDPSILAVDLSRWGEWARRFEGVDCVFHLAADPEAYRSWAELIEPNVDALIHVFRAAADGGVRRMVFASSNHVMGGYQDEPEVVLGERTPPRPGLRYVVDGEPRSSAAYGAAKLFGERLGRCYAESHGMECIALRIGWVWRNGANVPSNLPAERGEWFRLMWLSDGDFLRVVDHCLAAELPEPFVIVNAMSRNTGMPWDLEPGRRALGYEPVDDIARFTAPWTPSAAESPALAEYRMIDLTLPLRAGMRGVEWEPAATLERDGWNATRLHLYSHAGTHMDSQAHFGAGPETIDRIPLERCTGPARVVHLPDVAPRELLTPAHLGPVESTFRAGEILLLATGWSRHVDDSTLYRDGLPRVGEELAGWCVARGVKLLGVEPPSIASVSDRAELTRIHRLLLEGGVTIVEGLANLDRLPAKGASFFALPLPLAGVDGSPCRAFALVE